MIPIHKPIDQKSHWQSCRRHGWQQHWTFFHPINSYPNDRAFWQTHINPSKTNRYLDSPFIQKNQSKRLHNPFCQSDPVSKQHHPSVFQDSKSPSKFCAFLTISLNQTINCVARLSIRPCVSSREASLILEDVKCSIAFLYSLRWKTSFQHRIFPRHL